MIYLISIPTSIDYRYWVITDTAGATQSADAPIQAIANFEQEMFGLRDRTNKYTIAEHEVLSNGKFHGHILAKADTVQSLINNYPEYFI